MAYLCKKKKRGLPLECSYREMEWKSCNGRLIPNFPVKTFHFLPGEIRTCSHAELRQAEGGLLRPGDKLETDGVRQMGGAVRCNLQAWGDHWHEALHCSTTDRKKEENENASMQKSDKTSDRGVVYFMNTIHLPALAFRVNSFGRQTSSVIFIFFYYAHNTSRRPKTVLASQSFVCPDLMTEGTHVHTWSLYRHQEGV